MRLRHRQRAQITAVALFAMLVLTGALSLVVDAGVFFVTQRQLQTAVDAAALAAVWYAPTCSLFVGNIDCKPTAPAAPPLPAGWACTTPADCVGLAVLQENLGYTGRLCQNLVPGPPAGHTEVLGGLNYYLMTIDCDAPYWFARVFPSIPAVLHMRVFARATIGYPTTTGVTNVMPTPAPSATPDTHLVSRLKT